MRQARVLLAYIFAVALLWAGGPGFRTRELLDEHYRKHGAEFGSISKAEYLLLAQQFRDTRASGPVLEAVRPNGVVTKFDRRRGWFIAYNRNGIIRTFFIPAAGERYFRRQAERWE